MGVLDGADITGMQTVCEGNGAMGFRQSFREGIRVPDGGSHLHTGCSLGVVPVRVRVPDQTLVQPGIQPWPPDIPYLGWWKERSVIGDRP